MPPSGFSQKAINGLLTYVEESYQHTLETRSDTISERDALLGAASELENIAEQGNILYTQQAAQGLATFMAECYRDLAKEIDAGEDKYGRAVTEGEAIDKELSQIRNYLQDFTI